MQVPGPSHDSQLNFIEHVEPGCRVVLAVPDAEREPRQSFFYRLRDAAREQGAKSQQRGRCYHQTNVLRRLSIERRDQYARLVTSKPWQQ